MKSIRIKNLRCFEDTGYIDIKPINLLVGLNSTGKSSFARVFPLLKQSVERKISGAILWYGPYVDFGSYEESVNRVAAANKNKPDNQICLGIETSLRLNRQDPPEKIKHESYITSDSDGNGQLELFKLSTDYFEIMFEFKGDALVKISYNDSVYIDERKGIITSDGSLIPRPLFRWGGLDMLAYGPRYYRRHLQRSGNTRTTDRVLDCEKRIIEIIKPFFSHKSSDETITDGIQKLGVLTPSTIMKRLSSVFSSQVVFLRNIKKLNDEQINEICSRTWLTHMELVIETIYENHLKTCHSVKYVAPLRTTAERYYRHQDFKYDEVDHKGENLPLVLQSLSNTEKVAFEEWTSQNFGFKIRVEKAGWQYAVKIKPNNDEQYTNISDMGFGYSQIAPIITSLWYEIHRNPKQSERLIFVIEQPELHLHPGYQAKFIDLVSKLYLFASKKGFDINFIIETHSETIVNSLGKNITKGIVNKNDASILVFDKGIKKSYFDEDGFLVDWPIGFFEAY
ncbi:AAA family ATPase [Aeromonas veronii]|uniref:AAA family ATPase n=1 Tax=Aeromonas veronii TaxID=654 RepID=UPI003BA2865C